MKLTKTNTSTLYRTEAGSYVMRAKIFGRIVQRKLGTKAFHVARRKLPATHADEVARLERKRKSDGCKLMADLFKDWLESDASDKDSKPRTKAYHVECVAMVRATWKQLDAMEPSAVTERDCVDWSRRLRQKYSATRFNGCVSLLRNVFKLAIERGLCAKNPALKIKNASVKQKDLKLPAHGKFREMLAITDKGKIRREASIVVRFLAFTGMRIEEASKVMPAMVDFQNEVFHLPGEITKNGCPRDVPIIGELMPLVKKLCADFEADRNAKRLLPSRDPRRALKTLCRLVKVKEITNHDLRHLFATRCIESGVDIPTVSRWLGHKDGGALAMKTYGHLRDEHSREMAKKVKF